jgi:hypothetical protein
MSSPKSTLRFSLRGMLTLTSVIALIVMPLAKPWQGWLYAFPAIVSLLAITIVTHVMTASAARRVFWSGLLVGSIAFVVAVWAMDSLTSNRMYGNSVWEDSVCDPTWRFLHGDSVFRTNTHGFSIDDFRSFNLYVTVDAALLTATIGAGAAQFLASRRGRRSSSEGITP